MYCFHKNFKNKKKQVNIKAKIITGISDTEHSFVLISKYLLSAYYVPGAPH